jgi:glycosyltransferase involved in cell wall biosynthesis
VPIGERFRDAARERLRLGTLRQVPAAVGPLVSMLREVRPDVIYTSGAKAHILGSISSRLLGRPSVVHHRDILSGPARVAVIAAVGACSRARIATTTNVARCYPLANTTVIDEPVELARYRELPQRAQARKRLGIEGEEPVAAIVGRINRWKRIDRFLRAIAAVNTRTKLRGLIVGAPTFRDADYLPELRALRSQLGLDDLVTFVDWVEDAAAVYAAVDININTSDQEPFGRTVIEAAAAGVPSICFDDSGVSETMIDGRGGVVIRAHDEGMLAEALSSYASDSNLRAASGAAARSWAERFDAALSARHIADVLRSAARVSSS